MEGTGSVEIVVNGRPRGIAPGATVASLLRELSLPGSRVAVERNREIVRKPEYGSTTLAAGDRLEIVTFVGGG
ncbi:MAG TPA: sulfur carrier protein ThiS [Candidatus Deferrimicrobiaceae bacterium]